MNKIEGTIEEIIFTNESNGYTICDVKEGTRTITAVGYMPFINIGETLVLEGKWVTHPDYGEQLKVEFYEKVLPKTISSIEKYLASGLIKGIGPATAKKIVEKFGEDTLQVIQFQSERLSEIKGISHEKALAIGQIFEEQSELRSVIMFLQQYGISPAYSTRIYKTFGKGTIEEIRSNPYRLADEVFGIGFKTADKIAKSMGIDPTSKFRICSAVKYVLSKAASNGHTYLPEENLKNMTSGLIDVLIADIGDALVTLALDQSIYIEKINEENRIYLIAFYNAEISTCKKLTQLHSANFNDELGDFEKNIDIVQNESGIILAEKQKEAIKEAITNGVMVITGGPGTGKTTIIKSIIKLLKNEKYEVVLAAPTGRAAKRMSEATGEEAKTIHRLLEIGYAGKEEELVFARTESNPIDADVIIIDEASMVDILLMNHLLKAIEAGSRLILVGDIDQLPSVGAGNVLKDIISSGTIKTVKLNEIFRQAEESMIVVNAHRINSGKFPHINVKEKDFFFMKRTRSQDIVKTIVELCKKRLPDRYGYDPIKDIQILAPMKKGVLGVYNLNQQLQEVLNVKEKNKEEKIYRDFVFREGDRVMQIKNNYNLKWRKKDQDNIFGIGVFNGDLGIITEINNEEQKIVIEFDDERTAEYDFSILDEIEPAYAITIHKSQGSEFPVIIIPMCTGPQVLLTRNLLYTAITRAKNLVILVGLDSVIGEMINNQRETQRFSGLEEKMKRYLIGFREIGEQIEI